MAGREAVRNVNFLFPADQKGDRPLSEYVRSVRKRLCLAYAVVQEALQRSAEAASTGYNRKVKPHEFLVGHKVRLFYSRRFCGRTPK